MAVCCLLRCDWSCRSWQHVAITNQAPHQGLVLAGHSLYHAGGTGKHVALNVGLHAQAPAQAHLWAVVTAAAHPGGVTAVCSPASSETAPPRAPVMQDALARHCTHWSNAGGPTSQDRRWVLARIQREARMSAKTTDKAAALGVAACFCVSRPVFIKLLCCFLDKIAEV